MLILQIVHLVIAIVLMIVILMQSKGVGLSAAFGGSGGEVYQTKRGAEKVIFIFTILLAILFAVTSLLNILLS